MAITFDPSNRIVQLDSFTTSSSEIWSRWVDWAALSDNAKYGAVMSQLGGVAPVDLYIDMEGGWLVRPLEANGITKITGNVLVADGSSPIAATLGNWQVLVNMETPVKASAINISSGSGLDSTQDANLTQIAALVDELHIRLGLSAAKPLTNRSDGGISPTGIVIQANQSGDDIIQTRQ